MDAQWERRLDVLAQQLAPDARELQQLMLNPTSQQVRRGTRASRANGAPRASRAPAAPTRRAQPPRAPDPRGEARAPPYPIRQELAAGDPLMSEEAYAVPLPEHLDPEGSWDVYRSTLSPRRLVTTFAPPDEHVHTLYDNWETAVARFPHVRGALWE